MPANPHGGVFPPGLATGIGSRCRSRTPPRPPSSSCGCTRISRRCRSSRRRVRAWSRSGRARCPRSRSRPTARSWSTRRAIGAPVDATFTADAHAGLLGFLDAAAAHETAITRVKAQVVGPLTLGVALVDAGMPVDVAFDRAAARGGGVARGTRRALRGPAARRPAARVPRRAVARAVATRRRADRTRGRGRPAVRRARGLLGSRPASTCAATATCGSRSRRARPCSASRCRTRSSTTSARSCATSTPTAGSPGARCPPTAPSASRRSRSGVGSSRCGASSPGAAASRSGSATRRSSRPRAGSRRTARRQAERALRLAVRARRPRGHAERRGPPHRRRVAAVARTPSRPDSGRRRLCRFTAWRRSR